MTNDTYGVWAIEYEAPGGSRHIVAVSAESEYGAIKRLCGNRCVCVSRVEKIQGRAPEFKQRRIEGFVAFQFSPDAERWEYT